MLSSDRAIVVSRPTPDAFLTSFERYLVANELRCPSPEIKEGTESEYIDYLELDAERSILIDPNKGHALIPAESCSYWHFNRSFPLAKACQIWPLLGSGISITDILTWLKLKRSRASTQLDPEFRLRRVLNYARQSRESLDIVAFYVVFAGMGKRSKAVQRRVSLRHAAVHIAREPDPIMAAVATEAFGQFHLARALVHEDLETA